MNAGWVVFYTWVRIEPGRYKWGEMAGFLDGLVQGDEAKKNYVVRAKSADEKTDNKIRLVLNQLCTG